MTLQVISNENINFTSVLVPTLTWDPKTDKDILTNTSDCWVETGSGFLPRTDVARFMLSVVENPESWNRKFVAIAIKYDEIRIMKKLQI